MLSLNSLELDNFVTLGYECYPSHMNLQLIFFSPIIKTITNKDVTTYLITIFLFKKIATKTKQNIFVYAILQPIRIVIKPRIDVMNIFQINLCGKTWFRATLLELDLKYQDCNPKSKFDVHSLTKESLTLFLAHVHRAHTSIVKLSSLGRRLFMELHICQHKRRTLDNPIRMSYHKRGS